MTPFAALNPTTVVSGHKRVGAPDSPETIEQSRQYLRDFSRVVDEQETVEEIVAAMMQLHGDRDNSAPNTLVRSATSNRQARLIRPQAAPLPDVPDPAYSPCRLSTIAIGDKFLIVAHPDHPDLGVAR